MSRQSDGQAIISMRFRILSGIGNAKFMRETNPPEIYIITEYQALHPGIGDYIVKNFYGSFDTYTKSYFEQSFEEA